MLFLRCLSGGSSERTARCATQHPEASIPLSCREHTDVAEPDLGAADARSVLLVVQLSVVVETGRGTIAVPPPTTPMTEVPATTVAPSATAPAMTLASQYPVAVSPKLNGATYALASGHEIAGVTVSPQAATAPLSGWPPCG